jgi:hypothetical protein
MPDTEVAASPQSSARTRRERIGQQLRRLVHSIRTGDEAMAEKTVLDLSQRSRWLAPLAMVVGAFTMLFVGLKILFTNWRLALVQILPAMWIWAAMLDLKVHVIHGKSFHVFRGLWLIPVVLAVAAITAAAFYLNAVFAFAISKPGRPEIRPAFVDARNHRHVVLSFGFIVGIALGFCAVIVPRWGLRWFALSMGIVVGLMMFTYVFIPSRLIGVKSNRSRKDKLSATVIGGAVGALLCSPPYALGRFAIILLGSHRFFFLALFMLAVAVVLQTGATSSVKAVKMSMKLTVGADVGPTASDSTAAPDASGAEDAPDGSRPTDLADLAAGSANATARTGVATDGDA